MLFIFSKIGRGIDGRGKGPLKAGNDKIDYATKAESLFEGIVRNEKFIDEEGNLLTAGKSGKVPPGQIIGNSGNNGQSEPFRYFYHPDHLGSTSHITDATGEVYQHLEYFAFGETFVEEQGNTNKMPYKFNGKELDEETGLYYYGTRPPDYYLSYGDKYRKRFDNLIEGSDVSHRTKEWLSITAVELQREMELGINSSPQIQSSNEGFRNFAYDTHVPAYRVGGIYRLPISDLFTIMMTPDFSDTFFDSNGRKQIGDMFNLEFGNIIDWQLDRSGQ